MRLKIHSAIAAAQLQRKLMG